MHSGPTYSQIAAENQYRACKRKEGRRPEPQPCAVYTDPASEFKRTDIRQRNRHLENKP